MRVRSLWHRFVRQLAHYCEEWRRDTVYVPQHVTSREPIVVCPSCGCIFTPRPSDEISEGEARLIWGDR